MLTLLVGGARSGKTSLAVAMAKAHDGPVTYLATSPRIPGDDDLDERISRHQAERPSHWRTVEAELDLSPTLRDESAGLVVLDCLTLWVNNMLWRDHPHDSTGEAEARTVDIEEAAALTAEIATRRHSPTVVVSNEVGLGVHPETEVGRAYRDVLGRVNQVWARAADRTLFLAAGRAIELHDPGVLLGLDAGPEGPDGPTMLAGPDGPGEPEAPHHPHAHHDPHTQHAQQDPHTPQIPHHPHIPHNHFPPRRSPVDRDQR